MKAKVATHLPPVLQLPVVASAKVPPLEELFLLLLAPLPVEELLPMPAVALPIVAVPATWVGTAFRWMRAVRKEEQQCALQLLFLSQQEKRFWSSSLINLSQS